MTCKAQIWCGREGSQCPGAWPLCLPHPPVLPSLWASAGLAPLWQKNSAQIKLSLCWDIFCVGFVLSSSWESYIKSQHRVGGCFFSSWPAGIPNSGTLLFCQDKFHLLLLFSHATSCANQPFSSPSNPAINALLKLFFPRLISAPVWYPTLCIL